MKLYYSPGACSLSPHIVLAEAGIACNFEKVDLRATPHMTESGTDFTTINPKGSVPALVLDNGALLTEGAVIVQYLADLAPECGLIPAAGTFERYRVQEWLNFIGSEIHKGFGPLWMPNSPDALKAMTLERLNRRFALLDAALSDKEYLLGSFGVADAYLFTCLNWTGFLQVSLDAYPHVQAFQQRVAARPAVKRVMQEEGIV
jgi:glutathione S-transferase